MLLVQRNGRTVTSAYESGWNADRPHRIASGTKSFAGALGIAAAGAGLLSLDERVADTITEWRSDPAKSRDHGARAARAVGRHRPEGRRYPAKNAYRTAIAAPLVHTPGTTFDYGPNHFGVFAALVQRKMRAADLRGDALTYLQEHLFRPIGLEISGLGPRRGWASRCSPPAPT